MPYQISVPEISEPMQRVYTDLKGVDFSSLPSRVATYRSPEAKNVYKNYLSELGQAIETRPGVKLIGNVAGMFDNLLSNWDFNDGTDNWITTNLSNFQVSNGIASGTVTSQYGYMKQMIIDYEQYKGHKIYGYVKAKASSSNVVLDIYDGKSTAVKAHTGSNEYEKLSAILTVASDATRLEARLQDNRTSDWDAIYSDEFIMIDLTARFGAGKEPSLATMDAWRDGMLARTDNNIYGIHVLAPGKALIHCGESLYIWNTFPNDIIENDNVTDTGITMNKALSSSFIYNGSLYILDQLGYYVYNGSAVSAVTGYVPTTSIGASPDGSGRVVYQGVNFISDYRKNTFSADGTTAVYCLDATEIDSAAEVTVKVFNSATNQWDSKTLTTHYTVNTTNGTVTFTAGNIPQAPSTPGTVNVEITFKKHVNAYAEHILGCTLCKVFDNRVFISGNDDYRGVLFHSELDNPAYFSDENWYLDGSDNTSIKSLVSASDKMVCIKEDRGLGVKVYYHNISYDSTYGNIYPVSETEIHLGACAEGINFRDTIVYLSKQGLESIYSTSQLLHKSSLVDTKLINEAGLENAKMAIWNNYLCILINGKIYLADSRQQTEAGEYEWYYWDSIGVTADETFYPAVFLAPYDTDLYFGTSSGHICKFAGTHDDSLKGGVVTPVLINSCWTTPMDVFNSLTHLKTTNKRGGVVQVKRIPNSVFKIAVSTDKEGWDDILTSYTTGFSFENLRLFLLDTTETARISFGTGARGFLVFKVKKRKIKYFSIKFYSDEIDRPFGLYEATIEFTVDDYVKS
ncbi:MAG: hypothetical protein AAGU14_02650 [Eubacteriaceae bacterium]